MSPLLISATRRPAAASSIACRARAISSPIGLA